MSFTDLMSSGRGPGVIGLLLALLVLVGFGSLFTFATDQRFQGADQSIESVIAYQAKELILAKGNVEESWQLLSIAPERTKKVNELSKLKLENQILQQRKVSLVDNIGTSIAEETTHNEAVERYKDEYRAHIRAEAKGKTLPSLETKTGVTYKNVSIREVTAFGMQIRHDDGFKRIPFEELSDSMKDYYQFDPKQKATAVATEQALWNQHEAAAAVANDLAKELSKQKENNAKIAQEKNTLTIAAKRSQIVSIQEEISNLRMDLLRAVAQSKAARSAGHIYVDNSAYIQGCIQSKEGQISILKTEINTLSH
jgi:hypothetical protein